MPKYVFNPITLTYEEVHETPSRRRPRRIAVAVITGAALCFLYFWLYTSVLGLDLPKTARLKREADGWRAKMALAERRLSLYETTLEGIEGRNGDVYRSIYGLTELPKGPGSSPFSDGSRYSWLDEMQAPERVKETMKKLDDLTWRAYVQSGALDEVYATSLNAGDMVSHIPAVPPCLPDKNTFRLSSPFGYRDDPIYGGTRLHEGQDIGSVTGNPVYATGDGVIEKVEFKFTGYGNQIVINHGFGYETRYAHLSRIDVAEGMKVKRGDLIGAVGSTGKSTSPHLHYEVLYRGEHTNPMQYMDPDMSIEDYKAMIESRKEANTPKPANINERLRERKR